MSAAVRTLPAVFVRRLNAHRTEPWVLGLSAVAWVVMAQHMAPGASCHLDTTPTRELGAWTWMIAAMMLPFQGILVNGVAARSLRRRRQLAIGGFVAGYLGIWALLGVPAVMLRVGLWEHAPALAALAFGLSVWWSGTRTRREALEACHNLRPLAPRGWPALHDTLAQGAQTARVCALACWPLMLGCMLTGHSAVAMAGGLAIGALERFGFRPHLRAATRLTALLAALQTGVWLLGGD